MQRQRKVQARPVHRLWERAAAFCHPRASLPVAPRACGFGIPLHLNVQQEELAAIWSMGFDVDIVQRALVQADGSESRAVELIVTDR